MKTFFKELFEYNELVNQKTADSIGTNIAHVLTRTIAVAGHIQSVHLSWNNRMAGKAGLNDFWQPLSVNDLKEMNHINTQNSLAIINDYDLLTSFSYKNSKGAAFENIYADALFHIINHSSYHRGQINAGLRNAGIEPVIGDYIFYKR